MKSPSAAVHPFWSFEAPSRDPSATRAANLRMPQTPHQLRADRTTSLVREITDAATKERTAKVARLREARLAQERVEEPKPPAVATKARRVKK